ncbi:MAG: SusC/RagA family TonB-linked outer membrane protein [Bacteroidales bacterium]|nr:SusC/RagA family TonB-linked outer membrane protein [Bacteroidales bacterium]
MSVKHFFKGMFLALALVLGSAQAVNAQNITLNFDRTPLKTVLNEIQKQVDYTFVYNDQQVGADKPVTIHVQNAGLTAVLDQMLRPLNINYKILDKQIALSPAATTAQQQGQAGRGGAVVLKGRITDQDGQPIAGAAVQNLTEKTYAITDVNGNYTLAVKNPRNSTIEVTFLGMDTVTEPLNGRSNFDVQMSYSRMFIEGAVVTGYQEIQQKKVTGAIATVSSKTIEERYTPSLIQNLEGRVAGLSTYGGKLTIRGVSSMYAEANPLLVVDGLPMEGSIDDLNPYDIESINVLKDAAAAAIYGARASNGIIVVTTKSAREKGRIDVDFSTNVTVYAKRNMDYAQNFYMNAEQQVALEKNYYDYYYVHNDGEVTNPAQSMEQNLLAGTGYVSPIDYAYYRMFIGEGTQAEIDQLCSQLSKNNFAQQYADAVYRRQLMQQYNLALRSRSDRFQSNFVINWRNDNAGIINTFDRQMQISYKGSYDVAKWLTATVAVNGIYGNTRSKGSTYNGLSSPWNYPAYESLYNSDGSDKLIYTWYNGNAYRDNTEGGYFKETGINLVDEYYNNVVNTKRQYMRYHGDLLFKIVKGLTANAQFVYETDHRTADWLATQESQAARTIYNAYTEIDPYGNVTHLTPASGGFRADQNVDGRYWTGRGQLNYSGTFGKHEIVALAGLEVRETLYAGTSALMLGYDDQLQNASTATIDFATISQMRYSSNYMALGGGFPAVQFAYTPYIRNNMDPVVEQHHRYASGYANFTYTYDEKYNVFGSFRKDYADVYGLNVKLRGRPLWSAGVAWNINNENFLKGVDWINALKLRVSYGVTGNIYQGATSYMTATSTDLNYYTNEPFGVIQSPANPNLKWERTLTSNVGIDFSFVENRFRGSLDYYRKLGKDLFSYKTLDPTTGFTSMFMNVADMVNNGVELTFTGDWIRERRRSDFGWSSTLTFALNKNRITNVENASTRAYELLSNPYVVGYPTSALWSWRFAGISEAEGEKGQTLWFSENDRKTHMAQSGSVDIMEYSGQAEPVVIAGLDNRFTWNGLSLSVLMAYYGGHVMRALAETEIFGVGSGGGVPSYFLNAWTPENKTNTPGIGRYSSNSLGNEPLYSDVSVRSAAFLKIRNIVLGYELPENWARRIGASRVNLQFQVDNIPAIWTAFNPGRDISYYDKSVRFDPETLGIPQRSSYIFGLHINF